MLIKDRLTRMGLISYIDIGNHCFLHQTLDRLTYTASAVRINSSILDVSIID